MKIFIPTKGRPDRQRTSALLIEAGVDHVLVTEDNPGLYENPHLVLSVPPMSLVQKRQWIVEQNKDKFIMMDDDLRFRHRAMDSDQFKRCGPRQIQDMIAHIEGALEFCAHVGLTDEFMCTSRPRGYLKFGRYNGLLAYNPKFWRSLPKNKWPRFRLNLNHDHDFALQLYALGFHPAIFCDYTKSSKFYAKGGLHAHRRAADEKKAHEILAQHWPHLVSVVPSKTSLSGYRIAVKWKKAFEQTQRKGFL